MSAGTDGDSERDHPAFIDTSVIVRYLSNDPPDAAERAQRIIGSHARLLITPGTLAETAYVLTKVYGVPRAPVVDAFIALLRRFNIHVHGLDKTIAIQALLLCRSSNRVSFADAMLWAEVQATGADTTLYTFDRRFPTTGIRVRNEV